MNALYYIFGLCLFFSFLFCREIVLDRKWHLAVDKQNDKRMLLLMKDYLAQRGIDLDISAVKQ